MNKKITVVWLSWVMILSFLVTIIEIVPIVEAPTTWYVDDVLGNGAPGNPPEDFTSIQDAINVAQPGDTVFVYNGTYFENVVVNKTINLTGENKENTIINGGGSGTVVYVNVSWANITGFTVTWSGSFFGEGGMKLYNVKNCKVINNIISSNMGYGIYLESSMDNKVIDNNISSNNQHNIYLSISNWNDIIGNNISSSNWGDGINLISSSNNNILGNNISNNFDGIEFYSSSNNNITGNNISSNEGFGIYLRSSSSNNFASNNFINEGIFIVGSVLQHFNSHSILSNNIVNRKPLYFYKDSSDINIDGKLVGELIFANCTDVKVQNLHINDTDVGIEAAFSTNIMITDNTFSNDNYGIYFWSSNGNNIVGNTASLNDKGIYLESSSNNNIARNKGSNNDDGISLESSSNHNIIIDNDFSSNANGIFIVGSSNNCLSRNTFSNNGEGMRLYTSNNIITDNKVISNSWGIRLYESSSNNKIIGNNASSNVREGIYLQNSANGNIILGNNVLWNGYSGIRISSLSNNNDIIGNNVSYNGYSVNGAGIFIESQLSPSSNNLIYHNNIIDNAIQASDTTNNGNQWDNGYPEGGNYWSDFDESSEGAYDDFNGPDQMILGSDGIVDNGTIGGGGKNPYVIDSNSQDNYPLIEPNKNYMILKQGWNLISLPLIQEEQNLIKVLKSIDGLYDAVQWYNITEKKDQWKHYKVGKPYGNDLFELNEKMGFWIHITQPGDTIFFYNGTRLTENQSITL
ncbi:MAG: right-handed parallel beta-helix repeat-containing protein, partial [Thermoplasmata archaeon]